jgi:hypothetical protein
VEEAVRDPASAVFECGPYVAGRTIYVRIGFPQFRRIGASRAYGVVVLISRFPPNQYHVWLQLHG